MKIVIVENPRPVTLEHYNDVANAPLSASLSSGYALAVARQAGWETAYADFSACPDDADAIAARILAEGGDLILFHWVYSWGNEQLVRAILGLLKAARTAGLGAFGLFPTLAHDRLARYAPQLDFIIVGEFEVTLGELLKNFAAGDRAAMLPGLYRHGEQFSRREALAGLSLLPVPDDVGANCAYPSMNIATSRGCFGACSFCFINQYYGCRGRRERSSVSFAAELEIRLQRRAVKSLYFIDPTFIGAAAGEKERLQAISGIVKGHGLTFGFETRADTLDRELVAMLEGNGASSIFLGVESGCDSVLQRLNKRLTVKQIVQAVRLVQDSALNLSLGFIMFEAETTLAELLENFTFLENLDLLAHHDQTINLLYHSQIVLYGSGAWQTFARQGRLQVDDRLPFEARYQFRQADVERVCAAMRRLSVEYFTRIDRLYREQGVAASLQYGCCQSGTPAGLKGAELNLVLKEAFLAFVRHAATLAGAQFAALEGRFAAEVAGCFS